MSASGAPPCRLDIFVATGAPCAVILRRGPTRQVRMIAWNTREDTFEDGQWVKHRVYPRKCSLSSDGRHFAYFGFSKRYHGGEMTGGFVGIGRVPYFTALAFLPEGSTWGRGVRFIDRHHVLCPYLRRYHIAALPLPLVWVWRADDVDAQPEDGVPPPRPRTRPRTHAPDGFVLADGSPAAIDPAALARVRTEWPIEARDPELPEGCIVLDGCLYRELPDGTLRLLRDFNAMSFEAIEAPYQGVGP